MSYNAITVSTLPYDLKMKIIRDCYESVTMVEDEDTGLIAIHCCTMDEQFMSAPYVYQEDAVNRVLSRLYVKLVMEIW